MNTIIHALENIGNTYENQIINATVIISVLMMVLFLSIYVFLVYRLVSHRSFYNKSFNICIAILPFFIATIILCLQSNIVITLGTIGALAIIRFRTAVKDPVDMMYILWSIYIGIICGCQLYETAVLTSIVVTVFLIVLNNVSFGRRPFVLVLHCRPEDEDKIFDEIKTICRKYRVKSRNYTSKGMDYVIELSVKQPDDLAKKLREIEVERFSIIDYDSEDVI